MYGPTDPTYAHLLATRGLHSVTDIVRLLVGHRRCDPTADGNYALLHARKNGHAAVVDMLLQDPRVMRQSSLLPMQQGRSLCAA